MTTKYHLTTICLSLGMTSAQAELLGHWKFDEIANASIAANEVGDNDGEVRSGITTGETGIIGNAYLFDGTSEGNVRMGNATFIPVIAGGNELTFSCWVKTSSAGSAQAAITLSDNTSTDQYFQLGLDNSGNARCVARSVAYNAAVTTAYNDDNWHHFAATFHFEDGQETTTLYVDGELKNILTESDDAPTNLNDFHVGSLIRSSGIVDLFTGLIDDVQVYNEAIGADGIAFLFDNPGETFSTLDSDEDGMADFWESRNGLVVGIDDSADDNDSDGGPDGLTNLEEFLAGTNPQDSDTDDDGRPDGDEIKGGGTFTSNPLLADSDGDSINDFDEINGTFNSAYANAATDPENADTDEDGYSDSEEIQIHGTNPNDDQSYPITPGLPANETFAYEDLTNLDGQSGGSGWAAPWLTTTGGFTIAEGKATSEIESQNNATFRQFAPTSQDKLYLAFTASIPDVTDIGGGIVRVAGISLYSGQETGTEWTFLGFRNDFFRLDGTTSGNANDRSTEAGTAMSAQPTCFLLEVIFDQSPGGNEIFNAYIFPDNTLPDSLPAVPTLTTSYNIGDGVALDTLRIFDNNRTVSTFESVALATSFAGLPVKGDTFGNPVIQSLQVEANGDLLFTVTGTAATTYNLTGSPDLATDFAPLSNPVTVTTDASGMATVTVPATTLNTTRYFFRLEK
ncbi:LamG-like jellyroll fold domain-containing protein [Verrucomicrobiaceae bacterium 227]